MQDKLEMQDKLDARQTNKIRGENMTNVYYMCFGIFLFVLGGIYPVVLEALRTYMKEYMLEERKEKRKYKEAIEEPIEETIEEPECTESEANEPVARSYDEVIQTYPDIPKASPEPPKSDKRAFLFDYEPAIHDIDVEIMTQERELELYKRAVAGVGGAY